MHAPEIALYDVTLNKATVCAFPAPAKLTTANDKAFNVALVKAFTQAKLDSYNKFGTDKTV